MEDLEWRLESWETYEQGLESQITTKRMWLKLCIALGFKQEAAAKQAEIDELTTDLIAAKQQKISIIKRIVNQVNVC